MSKDEYLSPLDYQFLQINVLLTIRHLAPIYGAYRMYKHKEFYLNLGPFFIMNNLQILGMIIYQQKITKVFTDELSAQLLFGVFFHLSYLIYSGQYAQIVYQVTIMINISWQVRQWTQEEIGLANEASQYMICLCPMYGIFKAVRNKDIDYLSKWYMFCNALESTVWIISLLVTDKTILSIWPPIIRYILLFGSLRVYAELTKLKRIKIE